MSRTQPKKHISKQQLAAEIIGWYGTAAVLAAYTLVSFDVISSDSLFFQLLNLTGALGIIVIAAYKKVGQSVVLNIVWGGVAVVALVNLLIN